MNRIYTKRPKDRVVEQPISASYCQMRAPNVGPSNLGPHSNIPSLDATTFEEGQNYEADPMLQMPSPLTHTFDVGTSYQHISQSFMPPPQTKSTHLLGGGWSEEALNTSSFAIKGEDNHHDEHVKPKNFGGVSYSWTTGAQDSVANMDIDEDNGDDDEDANQDNIIDYEVETNEEAARSMVPIVHTEWKLTKVPVPGGPLLTSVITSFGGHVAVDLWSMVKDRGVLEFKPRKNIINRWGVTKEVTCRRARNMIGYSGLQHLSEIIWPYNNMSLISAFVEWWQPDTNSVHMPWGEMTITLHDVWMILQIPIIGHAVQGKPSTIKLKEEMAECLAFRNDVERMTNQLWHSGVVVLKNLIEFGKGGDRDPMKQACAWLYYIISTTIFAGKGHGRLSPPPFLLVTPMRHKIRLNTFAWGAGTLAWLYRQLGMASRANTNGIAGCMTLLECWIYAYFPTLRPALSSDWRDDDDRPWAMRWVRSTAQQHDYDSLESYRKHLDALGARNVDWLPYGRDMVNIHGGCTWYRGTIQFMGLNEPYMPERCLRQYGYIQGKPPHPIRPILRSE